MTADRFRIVFDEMHRLENAEFEGTIIRFPDQVDDFREEVEELRRFADAVHPEAHQQHYSGT